MGFVKNNDLRYNINSYLIVGDWALRPYQKLGGYCYVVIGPDDWKKAKYSKKLKIMRPILDLYFHYDRQIPPVELDSIYGKAGVGGLWKFCIFDMAKIMPVRHIRPNLKTHM